MKMLLNLITGLTTSIQLIEASEKQMTPILSHHSEEKKHHRMSLKKKKGIENLQKIRQI